MTVTTEHIWETFHLRMRHFIQAYTHDEAVTEDILQDIFLKIHTHIETLKDESKLQSWLYQIMRHAIYDHHRSQRKVTSLPEVFDLPQELVQDSVEQSLLPSIKEMVDRLPEPYREAIILTEYEGLTQKALAERLNLSFSGAKSRVQRAREKLKHMLLECCHFVLDRRGHVIAYHPRQECCVSCACGIE